jgi:hypothetical protein
MWWVSFPSSNENQKEVIDHIKCSLVELLCSLSGVASGEAEDVSSGTNGNIVGIFNLCVVYLG